ncbi:MAG: class I SAM-dependent methyltransferase [Actinomycetia bacterium]|nr:class I SAM-dependent methyltransferase [Actinomycetes bacterium]
MFFAALGELDWYAASHRQWVDDQKLQASDRVLEVGCATGALTAYLADGGYRVTGVDRSRSMIRRARKDHPDLDLAVADATVLPYEADTFGAVFGASLINVVPDAAVVLTEMRRVARPGGTMSVIVPIADFTDDDLDGLISELGLSGFSRAALTKWHQSATKMERSVLEELFHSVGFGQTTVRTHLGGMLVAICAEVQAA